MIDCADPLSNLWMKQLCLFQSLALFFEKRNRYIIGTDDATSFGSYSTCISPCPISVMSKYSQRMDRPSLNANQPAPRQDAIWKKTARIMPRLCSTELCNVSSADLVKVTPSNIYHNLLCNLEDMDGQSNMKGQSTMNSVFRRLISQRQTRCSKQTNVSCSLRLRYRQHIDSTI